MGSAKINFPPGVYFNPADDDLIQFFLKPKALGENLVYDVVEEKQVYGSNCTPYRIFDPNFWFVNPAKKSSEKVWYVFTNLSKIGKGKKMSRSRSRVNMKKEAGLGTWVGETGKKKIRDSEENVIGETRLLVYKNNEIDPAAGEVQFGYYKMHEYTLSGIYAHFDQASTLVLCKITFDSSKRCSFVKKKPSPSPSFVAPKRKRVTNKSSNHKKKNLERGVGDQPSFVAPKRVSNKSSSKRGVGKNLERGVGDHFVEKSVCDSLAQTVYDNLEGSSSDSLVKETASHSLVGVPNFTEFGEDLGVDVNFCFGVSGDHDRVQGRVCDSLAGTICESGAGDNLEVGVQCITEFAENIGLDHTREDFGSSDNLIKETACDTLVGVQNIIEFGENLGLDQLNFCFGASGGHDPVEGSVCVNEFRDGLDLDDLPVGFCFEDEWIQELMNPIQDIAMSNLGKRKFEAENSCMAKKVAIITPFNFPLEIPVLQLMGALYMGNKPVLKVDSKVCIVMEQMLRLLHKCGLPMEDVDFINSDGKTMNKLLLEGKPRMTLFTGSSRVAELLAVDLKGRIKLEDAGFDWKILGPDVQEVDYVAWVCDQDAYACSGQKCSAQSMLFMHENWSGTALVKQLDTLAARRKLEDLTIGPVLTVTTETMLGHLHKLLQIPGSKLLFGGEALANHKIPSVYGAIKPTAVFVPLDEILKDGNYELVTTEIFGPFQIITEYKDNQLSMVLDALERMHAHLTAAVVSNDPLFMQKVIGNTVNGTTYAGLRARTTGAPQNHWFGPAGDPRGAGIGTPEAIKLVWSCHREVIYDIGPMPENWQLPAST